MRDDDDDDDKKKKRKTPQLFFFLIINTCIFQMPLSRYTVSPLGWNGWLNRADSPGARAYPLAFMSRVTVKCMAGFSIERANDYLLLSSKYRWCNISQVHWLNSTTRSGINRRDVKERETDTPLPKTAFFWRCLMMRKCRFLFSQYDGEE